MKPWSYSNIDAFESCPKKFYHTKVARDIVEPPNEHAAWGTRVHTACENFVLNGEPLPEGMKQWQPMLDKLVALKGEKIAEKQFAIDKNFQPTEWKTSWSRGLADLLVINGKKALVADYKTGKRKLTEQLELYAGYTFAYYPEVQTVTTMFIWLKEKKIDRATIERDELHTIWQPLLPRIKKLEDAYENDRWPAKTSGLCKAWCPVTSCKYNGKRDRNDA